MCINSGKSVLKDQEHCFIFQCIVFKIIPYNTGLILILMYKYNKILGHLKLHLTSDLKIRYVKLKVDILTPHSELQKD